MNNILIFLTIVLAAEMLIILGLVTKTGKRGK